MRAKNTKNKNPVFGMQCIIFHNVLMFLLIKKERTILSSQTFTITLLHKFKKMKSIKNMWQTKMMQFLAVAIMLLCTTSTVFAQLKQGDAAPEILLKDQNNIERSLFSLKGNLVLVYFWVSWDSNSRKQTPKLQTLYNKYRNTSFQDANGFAIYTVSLDTEKKEWTAALRNDGFPGVNHVNDFYARSASEYGIEELPTSFLVDANGIVWAANPSIEAVDNMLQQRATGTSPLAMNVNATPTSANTSTTTSVPAANDQSASSMAYFDTRSVAPPNTVATNTPASTQPVDDTPVIASGKSYKIQLGAFSKVDMNKFIGLAQYGNITKETTSKGITKVLMGTYNNKSAAIEALQKVQAAGYTDAFIGEYEGATRKRIIGKNELEQYKSTPRASISNKAINTIKATANSYNYSSRAGATYKTDDYGMADATAYSYRSATTNTNTDAGYKVPDDASTETEELQPYNSGPGGGTIYDQKYTFTPASSLSGNGTARSAAPATANFSTKPSKTYTKNPAMAQPAKTYRPVGASAPTTSGNGQQIKTYSNPNNRNAYANPYNRAAPNNNWQKQPNNVQQQQQGQARSSQKNSPNTNNNVNPNIKAPHQGQQMQGQQGQTRSPQFNNSSTNTNNYNRGNTNTNTNRASNNNRSTSSIDKKNNDLSKAIDNYLGDYEYATIESTKSKRLKQTQERRKNNKKKKGKRKRNKNK